MLLDQGSAFLDEGVGTRVGAVTLLEQALETGMALEKSDFFARESDAQHGMELVRVGLHDVLSMRQLGIESMSFRDHVA